MKKESNRGGKGEKVGMSVLREGEKKMYRWEKKREGAREKREGKSERGDFRGGTVRILEDGMTGWMTGSG